MTLDNDKARELFNVARNLSSEDREPLLDKECGEDDALRVEVDALLKHYDFTSAQTENSGEEISHTVDYEPGDSINQFKIIGVLGEGGMGIVYLAEQSKPVRRRVALKVIKAGMDTKQVIARFEAERQALAIMNHPGIAQVYEAGATEEGRPYFVLEFVKGMPITDACDEHKLNTKQRLELLAKVCDAVQHAHQKGIIHRDLKPSNILVSVGENDVLEPKIIDFGVAKATNQQLTDKTLVTQVGRFIGTPAYMSPEQADLKAIDIDAKTDVYALGVVLYEVLTGMPPFDPQTLRDAGLEKMREIIRTQPPPKPSTQLSSISDGDDATKIAQARQTQIATLAGLLRKELEWIPLKALKKQRSERYDSAKSMGDDIRRYLAGEPLEAGPDSSLYTFKKTLRKHKGPFIAAATILFVLVVGITFSLYFAFDAVQQRKNAVADRIRAIEQTKAANEARSLAEQAREQADAARVVAEQQRASALQQAYYGSIHAANAAINQDERASAIRRLDAAHDAATALELDDLPFEWKYLHAKNDNSLALLHGHENGVTSVAFSPDGSRIVSGSHDNTVRLWDVASGEELAVLEGHESNVGSVAFSPDGSRIVSGSKDKTLRLWDVASGEQLALLKGHLSEVSSVAFSPDGSRIVSGSHYIAKLFGSFDNPVRLWDVASGEELALIKGTTNFNGTVTHQHKYKVNSVAFSPDGSRIVSGSDDKTIRLWDTATTEQLDVFSGHESMVHSVAFSPDGSHIVSGSYDNTVRLWDVESGEELAVLEGHENGVLSVAFSPEGLRIISGGFDNTVRLWDIASGEELALLHGHEKSVMSVAFSPDGSRFVSGSVDETVRLWDVAIGEELAVLKGHRDRVLSVAFSPDGSRIVSGSNDKTLRLWDVASGEELAVLEGHRLPVLSVAFSPDGSRIVSGSWDKTVRVWDAATGEELAVLWNFNGHQGIVDSVAFNHDGSRIVSGSYDNTLRLWDVASGEELAVLEGHRLPVLSVAFSPDGSRIVSAGADGTLRIWDAVTAEELAMLEGHEDGVYSVAFSPDGSRIVSGSWDKTLRLWDTATTEQLDVFSGHESNVGSVAFNHDGSRIVSGSWDKTLRLWDVASGEQLALLKGHEKSVRSVDFSPDGSCIISGSEDNTVRIWNTKSRGHIAHERRRAQNRATDLSPIVTAWFEKTDGDSKLVLALLDREVKNRPPEDVITLRNLVLKKLVEQRQAK